MRGEASRVATAVDFSPVRTRGYALFINALCVSNKDRYTREVRANESESDKQVVRVLSSDVLGNSSLFPLYVRAPRSVPSAKISHLKG